MHSTGPLGEPRGVTRRGCSCKDSALVLLIERYIIYGVPFVVAGSSLHVRILTKLANQSRKIDFDSVRSVWVTN